MKMHNPPHPGEILKGLYLEPLNLTIKETAERLFVSRKALSSIINGHKSITPEMAIRLAKAFSTSPELWINHQKAHDLWIAEKKLKGLKIKPLYKKKKVVN